MLYNNASAPRVGPFAEMSWEDWRFTLHNELDLIFTVTRAAWPHLIARGGGAIVNTASVSAHRGATFIEQSAHGAAKGGVLAMTRHLAASGAPHGIRANSISPGPDRHARRSSRSSDRRGTPSTRCSAAIPLGRLGTSRRRRAGRAVPRLRRRRLPQRRRHRRRRRTVADLMSVSSSGAASPATSRRGWAGSSMPGGRTATRPAVLLAEDEDDVVAGVRLAADRGLQVSVRAGGHSWAAWSVRDDALLIDLGAHARDDLRPGHRHRHRQSRGQGRRRADAVSDRARPRVHAAATARASGSAASCSRAARAGTRRSYGWACEHVVAIDVVTADGELVHADETENTDLLWAARGAGPGFFGVITRFLPADLRAAARR